MQPFFNLGVPTFFFNLAVVAGSGKKNALQCSHVGHVTLLVLLDLSASFDTVDPDILIHGLQSLLGLRGSALQWFRSYLRGRSKQVTINGALSKKFGLECGVPQGSCLGPSAFYYLIIIKSHLPSAHSYVDDTQLYLSFRPLESPCEAEALDAMEKCTAHVRS